MTAKDRLKMFAAEMNMSMRKFCITAGISESYCKTFSGNPRPNIIRALEQAYPHLNINWLCTGEGNMFLDGIEPEIRIVNVHNKIEGDYSGNVAGHDISFADDRATAIEKLAALEKENARLQAKVEMLETLTDRLLGMLNK